MVLAYDIGDLLMVLAYEIGDLLMVLVYDTENILMVLVYETSATEQQRRLGSGYISESMPKAN